MYMHNIWLHCSMTMSYWLDLCRTKVGCVGYVCSGAGRVWRSHHDRTRAFPQTVETWKGDCDNRLI